MATPQQAQEAMASLVFKVNHVVAGMNVVCGAQPPVGTADEWDVVVQDLNKIIARIDDHSRTMLAIIHNAKQ